MQLILSRCLRHAVALAIPGIWCCLGCPDVTWQQVPAPVNHFVSPTNQARRRQLTADT